MSIRGNESYAQMAQDSRILIAFPDRQLAAMAEVLETPPFFFK